MSVFVGGHTPGASPWKMGIRTGAQTPEMTELLWLPLPSPSWPICLQRTKPNPKVPSAEVGSNLLAMGRLCLSQPCAVLLQQELIPRVPSAQGIPQLGQDRHHGLLCRRMGSVSLNPAALAPGELFPSVQTGNSFPGCVCSL